MLKIMSRSVYILVFLSQASWSVECNQPSRLDEIRTYYEQSNISDILNNTDFYGCEEYTQVQELTANALRRGLKCLDKVSGLAIESINPILNLRGFELREALLKIGGNFLPQAKRRFEVYCAHEETDNDHYFLRDGANASAQTCQLGEEKLGMKIHRDIFSTRSQRELKSTIFHEAAHHAGYFHDRIRHDWVYEMEFCCFGFDDSSYVSIADLGTQYSCLSLLSADHEDRMPSRYTINQTRNDLMSRE